MVNIVLCGPGGSGKHMLIGEIHRRCKKEVKGHRDILHVPRRVLENNNIRSRHFNRDDRKYERVIRDIIEQQCVKENMDSSVEFITDNCIIHALVHASVCLINGHDIVKQIVEGSELVSRSLERYTSSLVVLVGPCQYVYNDLVCLKLTQTDWDEMKKTYIRFFHQFKIAFIDLTPTELSERLDIVKEALDGKLALETSHLVFYNPKANPEEQEVQTSFSFYMQRPKREDSIYIPTIKITEHKYELDWTEFQKGETNRFIARHRCEHLACLEFHINVRSSIAQKILLNGVTINGEFYSFLGCSSSGLKKRKCYMWRGSSDEVNDILQSNGDFNAIKTVSKRLARVGLLFSGVTLTNVTVENDAILTMNDIEANGHNFSDGCGGIGNEVAKKVFAQVKDSGHDQDYLPSVYQIRFQGYKGVLALDETLSPTNILVRPSMKKFVTDQHPQIGVCDCSRAYTFGHLNKQFILLLSGLGVPDDVFLQKQNKHLEMVETMMTNSESAVTMLQSQNMFEFAQHIARVGSIGKLSQEYKQLVMTTLKRVQEKIIPKLIKLDLLITDSRNVFGICDTSDTLDYGECFLRLTVSGKPMTIRGQVVVCKNPCYLLGDVRVLTAVDDTDKAGASKLSHLVDCIVFPSRGKRPHSDEIAGSDLDGDQYFVSWDKDLIPRTVRPPYNYPAAPTKEQGEINLNQILSYFSRQNETQKMTGRVDKYFNTWADIKSAKSNECERLGQLFSRVIDASKTGEEVDIPKGLKPVEYQDPEANVRFVWQHMKAKAIEFEEKFKKKVVDDRDKPLAVKDVSTEFAKEIASRKYSNISEFEKFKFSWNHTRQWNESEEESVNYIMRNVAKHINFAAFGIVDRREAIEIGIPAKYVMNALNTSNILSEDDLKQFKMDSHFNTWKKYVSMDVEEFDWSYLYKTLTTNDRSLIVLDLPDDVILELQFLEKLETGIEQPVKSGTISAWFYSKQFDFKLSYRLGPEYVLDLTEDTLQLYRDGKKNLTFVWLKATDRKMTKRRWNKRVSDEVVNSLSVDLQRFDKRILERSRRHPLINKMPFVQIEIYAQKMDGTVPYWDTFDVNDILPVEESVEKETEAEDDQDVDFERLFPQLNFEEEITLETDYCEVLRNASHTGNPFLFKSVLQKWQQVNSLPADAAASFSKLLENMKVMVVPRVLPGNIQIVMSELTSLITSVLNDPETVFAVVSSLSRLHLDDIAHQIVQKGFDTNTVAIGEFLDILQHWEMIWSINTSSFMLFLQQLSVQMFERDEIDGQQIETTRQLEYIRHFGLLHGISLLQDMDMHKAKLEQTGFTHSATKSLEQTQTCIMYLKLDKTAEQEPTTISFYRTGALENISRIVQGQYVAITRQCDLENDRSFKSVCCIGQIQVMRPAPCTITVKIEGDVPELVKAGLKSDGFRYWRVDLIGNITTYTRVVSALKHFSGKVGDESLIHLLSHPQGFNDSDTRTLVSNESEPFPEVQSNLLLNDIDDEGLNEKQRCAVVLALERKLCLIQGPPGTGKTNVACHIIKEAVSMKRYKGVLVVAETNVAVDNLARRLRNELLIIRLGSLDGMANDLYDVSLEGQVKRIADREAKRTKIRDEHGDSHRNTRLVNKVLSSADVILATCAGAGEMALDTYNFEFVIVDEATQTMETTLLCSLAHGAKHLVMIGDHKQLGPIINDQPGVNVVEGIPDIHELSQSLFHRLVVVKEVPSCFLDTQHRMHPEIMRFPSAEFYESKLKAAASTANTRVIFPWPCEKSYMPLCFIDVEGSETKRGTSFCNLKEIEVIQQVIHVLLNVDEEEYREHRLCVNQIGILTLYQGQVVELKRNIKDSVTINSVDGFQGQEKDVIIVSTVRCNTRKSVGFSGDARRINVLLTRAKKGLIVVGNSKTLEGSEIWSSWLKQAPQLPIGKIQKVTPIKPANRSRQYPPNN